MKFLCLSTALAIISTSASAATIGVTLISQVKVGDNTTLTQEVLNGQNPVSLTGNESQSVSVEDDDRFGPGQGKATASYAIDQAAGSIKFGASGNIVAPTSQVNSRANGFLQLNLAETFSIQGTGDITFSLAIDGFLDTSMPGVGASFESRMRLVDETGAFGFDVIGSDSAFASVGQGASTVIDEVLSFTTTITKSQDYLFLLFFGANTEASAKGHASTAFSNANFLNTAFLSFVADDTLTVTASDSAFLSGAAPAPVPLPAGALLILTALAGLGVVKRSRVGV